MPYPNVEPIHNLLTELGFEKTVGKYKQFYVRMFGRQPIYLHLWEESICWDGDNTTHLQYRIEEPSDYDQYANWAYFHIVNEDGSYFHLDMKNIPTIEGLRLSFDNLMATMKKKADEDVRAAYEKYETYTSMAW